MSKINYSYTGFGDDTARAYGQSLGISTKASINICKAIRGMDAQKAVRYLEDVLAFKRAIPYTRFTDGVGHRPGNMAAGRYPIKASVAILSVLKSAIANAVQKGLADELVIVHISAQRAATQFHQGRQRRRMMKKSHIELVLKEVESKKPVKKQEKTVEAKKKQDAKSVSKDVSKESVSKKEAPPKKEVVEANVKQDTVDKEAQK